MLGDSLRQLSKTLSQDRISETLEAEMVQVVMRRI